MPIMLLPLVLMGADSLSAGATAPPGFVEVNADRVPWQPRPSMPARVPHFQAAGPEGAVVQIESIGPTSTDFIKQ